MSQFNNSEINNEILDESKTNILLSNTKKNINVYDYNNSKNYLIEYDNSSLLYINFIKNKLLSDYNINHNDYTFFNNFNTIKHRCVLNDIDNIIMIEKDHFNSNNQNDKNLNNDISDNKDTNDNNDVDNDIILKKYFELFNKYQELVLFVFLLTQDKTIDGIIQFFSIPNNKLMLNIIKNNQKEIVEMCTNYPNILELYYKDLLSSRSSYSSANSTAELSEGLSTILLSGNISDITSILNNIVLLANSNSTSTTISTTTPISPVVNVSSNNNSNLLLINDIQTMFPHSHIDDVSDLLNLFLDNTLII
tara:strand:+ start:226 stop:1146 length:921 start_codon:yes stop_codon:yes gene_type:complete